jgi:glycyl-tRNA synthetase
MRLVFITRRRKSKILQKIIEKLKCPECGGVLTPPRQFNLMLKTFVGPLENEGT